MSDDRIIVVEETKPFVGEPQIKTRHLWFSNNESSPPGLDARFCQSTFRYRLIPSKLFNRACNIENNDTAEIDPYEEVVGI